MRIVDRKTFLSLPVGTIYQKYEPCIFGELEIKHETLWTDDWVTASLTGGWLLNTGDSGEHFDKCVEMEEGKDHQLDFGATMRDGCFKSEQLFAVWSDDDIAALIRTLEAARKGEAQ